MLFTLFTAFGATLQTCGDAMPALPDGLDALKPRVVRIETMLGTGSGTVISPDGFVLTAAHVVGTAEKVKVVLADESTLEGQVLRTDGKSDTALVKVEATEMACLPMATTNPATGSDLFLMGSPGGEALSHSITKGVVSGLRDNDGVEVLQTDASLSPGYSGGPALGADGVHGVISFKLVGEAVEGLGFAATSSSALTALDLAFGDASDANIEAKRDESGGSIDAKPPEITDRPASPAPPITKKPCKGVDIEVKDDAFSGQKTVTARGADLFEFKHVAGGDSTLTLFFPMRSGMYGVNQAAMDHTTYTKPAVVDMKLEDGTTIKLHGKGVPAQKIGGFNAFITSDFPLTRELVEALASSGPTVERWTFTKEPKDFERSERQREKYFRPYFSCLLTHWTE